MTYRIIILHPQPDVRIEMNEFRCKPDELNQKLHELLNGSFEIVRPRGCSRNILMLVDDEGILKDLPYNPLAASLYGQYIAGTAILMREGVINGEPDIVGLQANEQWYMFSFLSDLRKGYMEVIEND